MIGAAVAISGIGLLVAHAAILAQFIGTTNEVLNTLAVVQIVCIVVGAAILVARVFMINTNNTNDASSPQAQDAPFINLNVSVWWRRLPGWLIFLCLLLIATVLLGELSIMIARVQGKSLSYVQHVPTFTVFAFCILLCAAWLVKYPATPNED